VEEYYVKGTIVSYFLSSPIHYPFAEWTHLTYWSVVNNSFDGDTVSYGMLPYHNVPYFAFRVC